MIEILFTFFEVEGDERVGASAYLRGPFVIEFAGGNGLGLGFPVIDDPRSLN